MAMHARIYRGVRPSSLGQERFQLALISKRLCINGQREWPPMDREAFQAKNLGAILVALFIADTPDEISDR